MPIKEKRISEIRKQEILDRIKAIGKRLKDEYHAERVILFGSYAKGEATKDSDVNILVITPTKERFFDRMATVLAQVRDLYDGLALSPIVLRPEEVAKRLKIGDQFVQEILEEGVEL
ncbi:nucleotidyltransferase domain-containing protein [bacterium]|nr:nucleotidyltransferase domain-containing protein [bacterium]MBU4560722.1 nucleotidyltransferase domain-containing protein [bacterium]MCG2675942.1 nucleotidyltransferase domain-containing protein [bacterium]MCG2677123.1 nucleotidyltransferase domain-containing protein [bacterium]